VTSPSDLARKASISREKDLSGALRARAIWFVAEREIAQAVVVSGGAAKPRLEQRLLEDEPSSAARLCRAAHTR
jgi:hypothetical protein